MKYKLKKICFVVLKYSLVFILGYLVSSYFVVRGNLQCIVEILRLEKAFNTLPEHYFLNLQSGEMNPDVISYLDNNYTDFINVKRSKSGRYLDPWGREYEFFVYYDEENRRHVRVVTNHLTLMITRPLPFQKVIEIPIEK